MAPDKDFNLTSSNLRWKKLGRIFHIEDSELSHSQVPFAIEDNGRLRVFFASRRIDAFGFPVSEIRETQFDLKDFPPERAQQESRIVLAPETGSSRFDESGVMPGTVIKRNGVIEVFYTGWKRSDNAPYELSIGYVSIDEKSGKIQDQSQHGIVKESLPSVVGQAQPVLLGLDSATKMIYQSSVKWLDSGDRKELVYRLRYAEKMATGGWQMASELLVPVSLKDESQTSPTILEIEGRFIMYFGYRGAFDFRAGENSSYRIGCAESDDLKLWRRVNDPQELSLGPEDWDSEMVTYPRFFRLKGRIHMLYCGNDFGRHGFGIAKLEGREGLLGRVVA